MSCIVLFHDWLVSSTTDNCLSYQYDWMLTSNSQVGYTSYWYVNKYVLLRSNKDNWTVLIIMCESKSFTEANSLFNIVMGVNIYVTVFTKETL